MSRVRGNGNRATELAMISLFRSHGITGWRRHARLFGKPDFVFPGSRVALFVDGCFWHGCPKHGEQPGTNAEFWANKLARNRSRDARVNATLRRRGWSVMRVWQHELTKRSADDIARRIHKLIAKRSNKPEARRYARRSVGWPNGVTSRHPRSSPHEASRLAKLASR